MRKLLIGLALSLVVTVASAEWVLVSENSRGDKVYADPATKKRTGNFVRMWEVQEAAKPITIRGVETFSNRVYSEYDCDERTRQVLQFTTFSGKMLTGEIATSVNQPSKGKEFVAPETPAETMLNYACK